LGWD
jgi:hypothetical protein